MQWGLNAIWAVDDFTAENGATRFVPGSHSAAKPQGSSLGDEDLEAKAAVMAAGSAARPSRQRWLTKVVIYYASTLHGSGENRSPKPRTGTEG